MANTQNLKPFKKGDPRINRNGRPKTFTALQKLAQQIAHEKAKSGGETLIIDGHSVTVAEAILRQWAQSKNPRLQQQFMEVAFGKVPNAVQLTGKDGEDLHIHLSWNDGPDDTLPAITPGTKGGG